MLVLIRSPQIESQKCFDFLQENTNRLFYNTTVLLDIKQNYCRLRYNWTFYGYQIFDYVVPFFESILKSVFCPKFPQTDRAEANLSHSPKSLAMNNCIQNIFLPTFSYGSAIIIIITKNSLQTLCVS